MNLVPSRQSWQSLAHICQRTWTMKPRCLSWAGLLPLSRSLSRRCDRSSSCTLSNYRFTPKLNRLTRCGLRWKSWSKKSRCKTRINLPSRTTLCSSRPTRASRFSSTPPPNKSQNHLLKVNFWVCSRQRTSGRINNCTSRVLTSRMAKMRSFWWRHLRQPLKVRF